MDTLIFEFIYGFKGINGQHWFELNFLLCVVECYKSGTYLD